jgi:hypothetical protein
LLWTVGSLVVGLGALLGGTGCEATVATEPVYYASQPVIVGEPAVVYVGGPPVADVEVYPAYVYGGTNVYFIGDRWYYRDGARWAYYREEPRELVEYRARANVVASASYGRNAPRSGAAPRPAPAPAVRPTGPIESTAPARQAEVHPTGPAQNVNSDHVVQSTGPGAAASSATAAPPSRRPSSRKGASKSRSKR